MIAARTTSTMMLPLLVATAASVLRQANKGQIVDLNQVPQIRFHTGILDFERGREDRP